MNKSYIYGLLITDGSLYLQNNKGTISLEVSIKDKDIVYKLYDIIPNSMITYRERTTNFSKNYKTIIFSNHTQQFRNELISYGFPIKDKTNLANTPNFEYNEFDFWRGVIDGDGSLGFTNKNIPFISLVTKSEILKQKYCEFLKKHYNIHKNVNRNKRDNVYNIIVYNETALKIANDLYLKTTNICIDRKYNLAESMQQWHRNTNKRSKIFWDDIQDNYILTHSIEDSAKYLNRTTSSIKNRLFRLKSKLSKN